MRRTYAQEEGAAYAAAAADAVPLSEAASFAATAAAEAAARDGGIRRGTSKGGRVVGRHRVDHRLLVVGLHDLPPPWDVHTPITSHTGQQQQQQQLTGAQGVGSDTGSDHQPSSSGSSSSSSSIVPGSRATGFGGLSSQQLDDVLLSSWLPRANSANGTLDGVGLGIYRYSLPAVNSDRATHLLQFDGASRNNPGGCGWGVLEDS
jgi:hypothetical protein